MTTFTTPGYYLIQLAYQYEGGENDVKYQYFAFEITSATPILNLYKTTAESFDMVDNAGGDSDNTENFYAHEYTNQNVYATWKDTEIFESKITGKLYYSTSSNQKNRYPSAETLKAVADKKVTSTNISGYTYTKRTLISDKDGEGHSYMLVLEVENSATKTYTYFTIDKEKISDLQVYQVSTGSLDNKAVYNIAKDSYLNPIALTDKAVIDCDFTMMWADKNSGANIVATYKCIPFIKNGTSQVVKDGKNTYIINDYSLGTKSNDISISKASINSLLDVNNVITRQGIYEFTLVDDAENILKYIVVLDRTEVVILATYGENQTPYTSGQMVSDYVDLVWGTHKAVDLTGIGDGMVKTFLDGGLITDYYDGDNNNNLSVAGIFKTIAEKHLLTVQHRRIEIKLPNEDNNYYYAINSTGTPQIVYNSGAVINSWEGNSEEAKFAQRVFDLTQTDIDLRINIDKDKDGEASLRNYTIGIIGVNKVTASKQVDYNVRINPDKALGAVYSASQDGEEFSNEVNASGKSTWYFVKLTSEPEDWSYSYTNYYYKENTDYKQIEDKSVPDFSNGDYYERYSIKNENTAESDIHIKEYYEGQASDDGVFVFEWAVPTATDNFKVTDVKYAYYRLMDRDELNTITAETKGHYYPYKYSETAYILKTEEGNITTTEYQQIGDRYRSNAINLGYETYYDGGDLVTRKVTKAGLYIVTRTIEITEEGSPNPEISEFSYSFFVDRNGVIEYSTSNITEKIVGQLIHASMPNSEYETGVVYNDFTKQGISEKTLHGTTIKYKVYLKTNKLPTTLQIPTGKYVTSREGEPLTSYRGLKLGVTVYFTDTYNVLGSGYKGQTVKLVDKLYNLEDGYIDLNFVNEDDKGKLAEFRNSRYLNTKDGYLTLPGEYVFVINDLVGKKVENGIVSDYNTFAFGVEITNIAPRTDVYAYAKMGEETSDKVYSQDYKLYTNQEKIEVEIMAEDKQAYDAQIDIKTVTIYRNDLGDSKPWLQLTTDRSGEGYTTTKDSYIRTASEVVVQSPESGTAEKFIIKLDSGLTLDGDTIVSYEEYTYRIIIQYILTNSNSEYSEYYMYKDYSENAEGEEVQFYSSEYTITIDRTPKDENVDNLMVSQGEYFTEYHNYLAEKNELEDIENINKNFAYRSTSTISDYYALSNNLFYQLVDEDRYNEATKSMYAFTIDANTMINTNGLSAIYFRQLNFDSGIEANTRMGLLPIIDTYFENSTGFYTFYEGRTAYSSRQEAVFNSNGQEYYYSLLLGGIEPPYSNVDGTYYEIVEKDLAGNYTQYIVYFDLTTSSNIVFDIHGNNIENVDNQIDTATEINMSQGGQTNTFIGVDYVDNIKALAQYHTENAKWYPYYANINVYNAKGERVTTIYTNSTSTKAEYDTENSTYTASGIETEIYEAIKNQGNYTIQLVDVFGNVSSVLINNYTSANYELNTIDFDLKKDGNGDYYICLSDVSSKIDDNTYWYATNIKISYYDEGGTKSVVFNTIRQENGNIAVQLDSANSDVSDKVALEGNDIIKLAEGDYTVTFTDVAGETEYVLLSTNPDNKDYKLEPTGNTYTQSNIIYTASEVTLKYNVNFYTTDIKVYINENTDPEGNEGYYSILDNENDYIPITLHPDFDDGNAMQFGSLRRFVITLYIGNDNEREVARTIEIWIDTRVTDFTVTNTSLVGLSEYVKVEFANTESDYAISDLTDAKYYTNVISETINISWTHMRTDYFTYNYQLYEFTSKDVYKQLLTHPEQDSYVIAPKDNTTGKYVLKVTVQDKNGKWIASKMYFIHMSTTITGLYKVTDAETDEEQDYASITNLRDIEQTFDGMQVAMAKEFGFVNESTGNGDKDKMDAIFASFGYKTAIPMYISTNGLELEVNKDNGVDCRSYQLTTASSIITFYYIFRSNYYTFAVTMTTLKIAEGQNILSVFNFETGKDKEVQSLFGKGTATTIYDNTAEYYKLEFSSYSKVLSPIANSLEKHNKIVVDVYYNNLHVKQVVGGDDDTTYIEFKNSGSYTLYIKDLAGNVQYFKVSNSSTYLSKFTVVVMKEVLYTINGSAPVEYAYYSSAVELQIDLLNSATGKNNYDINRITLQAKRNGQDYYRYTHPTGSTRYVFSEYGTYIISITAYLLGTEDRVTSYLVFSILNPNEARTAIDFTSISSYNIISVTDVSKKVEKDVTSKFLSLIQDKANVAGVAYNKLVSYERLAEAFGGTTHGKIKLKVLYQVANDDLLPARQVEFMFTLNNEKATINSSIEAGEKTTKEVTLKLNAANIYDQIGDCYLMVNDSVALVINANSSNAITEIKISEVGEYYIRLVGDSGNVAYSFNFKIKEPLNVVAIILIVIVVAIVLGFVGTFIWLRTRMKVR